MRPNISLDSPARGVWRLHQRRPASVNAYLVEDGDRLILIDTGAPRRGEMLAAVQAVEASIDKRLAAIALTHGHSDHAGALAELVASTGVPVYAHPDELPFIAGERSYGSIPGWWGYLCLRTRLAPLPSGTDLRPLPEGGRVGPLLACHTPGHTPGHLAFYHPGLNAWFAGDVLMYRGRRLTGPLWFFTYDIPLVRRSAARLLEPGRVAAVCPGHGAVLRQQEKLRAYLRRHGLPPATPT